jgi:hypothetical protein
MHGEVKAVEFVGAIEGETGDVIFDAEQYILE